jgi:uncharacterized membrane protein
MLGLSLSCSKRKERNHEYIPVLKIDIPNNLKDDEDIYDFILFTEENINELSDRIEATTIAGRYLITIPQDSLSLVEGLGITKIMLDFYSDSNQLQSTINEFDEYIIEQQSNNLLSVQQINELNNISLKFKQRVKLLNKKHKEFYTR